MELVVAALSRAQQRFEGALSSGISLGLDGVRWEGGRFCDIAIRFRKSGADAFVSDSCAACLACELFECFECYKGLAE